MSCLHYSAGHCRSCDLMGEPDPNLLRVKNLQELLGIAPEPTHRSEGWGFRNKIKITVGGSVENPALGLLQPDLTTVNEILDCPVQAPHLNAHLPVLKEFISRWRLTPYHIPSRTGELKTLILSRSPSTGETMLRFVLRSKEALDRIRVGLPELAGFTVVSVNLQPTPHAILEGTEEIVLTDRQWITHQTPTVKLHFTPQSFMQTNLRVADALYAQAVEWLKPWRETRGLDLFCGVGGFALHLAGQHHMRGAEINPSAARMAQIAAADNKLAVEFSAAPAEETEELWRSFDPRFVVVNPPRRGLGLSLSLVEKLLPEVLLYSSCSFESFTKDVSSLIQYNAVRTQIFEMFPHTNHFEILTLLVRR
jgi:23S rRNA (uracil747-C5)-methyltransferase